MVADKRKVMMQSWFEGALEDGRVGTVDRDVEYSADSLPEGNRGYIRVSNFERRKGKRPKPRASCGEQASWTLWH